MKHSSGHERDVQALVVDANNGGERAYVSV